MPDSPVGQTPATPDGYRDLVTEGDELEKSAGTPDLFIVQGFVARATRRRYRDVLSPEAVGEHADRCAEQFTEALAARTRT